jgi:ubiquinone/menaquinone biosynthesis C-methylase UbiE
MAAESGEYYATGRHLKAKHALTRTDSGRDFVTWALEHTPIEPKQMVLDAGCGWGRFTWPLLEQVHIQPENLLVCDASAGMLDTFREEATRRGWAVEPFVAELQALPLSSASLDGVVAAHVLYLLPDVNAGIRELARVLRPSGWLLATTNSDAIEPTILELHHRALEVLAIRPEFGPSVFSMENGSELLGKAFQRVDSFLFEDQLTYDGVKEFMSVYKSTGRYVNLMTRADLPADKKRAITPTVTKLAEDRLQQQGVLRTPILMGAFVCREPLASASNP